jgi:hypothetical protein
MTGVFGKTDDFAHFSPLSVPASRYRYSMNALLKLTASLDERYMLLTDLPGRFLN